MAQRSAQFLNAGSQRLEVVPVFDAGVLDDFLQAFAVESNRIHAKDGVLIKGGELRASRAGQLVHQDVHVHTCLFDNLPGNFAYGEMLLFSSWL